MSIGNEQEERVQRLWMKACKSVGDDKKDKSPNKFYTSYDKAPNIFEEIDLCRADAANGDARALRYLTKFLELRMTD